MNYLKNNDWYIIDEFETLDEFLKITDICVTLFYETRGMCGANIEPDEKLRWTFYFSNSYHQLYFENEEDALCILLHS